jgi:N-formylglutamate amidohydrolase
MEKIGQGILYTDFISMHRAIEQEEEQSMIAYYMGYIKTLKEMLNEHSLLIDCHSFPSDLSESDICIGFNDDWSRPSDFIIDLVVEYFKKVGYKVSINSPYSNAIAPETNFTYSSIMIEVNKRVYLNEQTLEFTDNAQKLQEQLSKLYSILLRYNEEFII